MVIISLELFCCLRRRTWPVLSSRAQDSVIARFFCHRERRILSSRGTKRSRPSSASKQRQERLLRRGAFCHREERGDLGCLGLADSQKRDCFAGSQPPKGALTEYPSQACIRLSSRGTWRSRLFRVGEQRQERLLRKLAMTRSNHAVLASLSSRGTRRSRLFRASGQSKERLLRRDRKSVV